MVTWGDGMEYRVPCNNGCPMPYAGFHDPFYENTESGFRGYAEEFFSDEGLRNSLSSLGYVDLAGRDETPGTQERWAEAAVCGRTCGWFFAINEVSREGSDQTLA